MSTAYTESSNGQAAPPRAAEPQAEPKRVKFGPRDNETMPISWASDALTWLKANRSLIFAEMMQRGVFGIEGRAGGR